MVGPPSPWSSRDQEDGSWQVIQRCSQHAPRHPTCHPEHRSRRQNRGNLADQGFRSPLQHSSGWAASGGEMLFKIAIVLLSVWIIGVVGLFEVGDLVHVLLLGGLLLLLMAFAKAREAAVRGTNGRSRER